MIRSNDSYQGTASAVLIAVVLEIGLQPLRIRVSPPEDQKPKELTT